MLDLAKSLRGEEVMFLIRSCSLHQLDIFTNTSYNNVSLWSQPNRSQPKKKAYKWTKVQCLRARWDIDCWRIIVIKDTSSTKDAAHHPVKSNTPSSVCRSSKTCFGLEEPFLTPCASLFLLKMLWTVWTGAEPVLQRWRRSVTVFSLCGNVSSAGFFCGFHEDLLLEQPWNELHFLVFTVNVPQKLSDWLYFKIVRKTFHHSSVYSPALLSPSALRELKSSYSTLSDIIYNFHQLLPAFYWNHMMRKNGQIPDCMFIYGCSNLLNRKLSRYLLNAFINALCYNSARQTFDGSVWVCLMAN